MNIPFVKLSPTQNVTLLVTSPVPRALQPGIAARLLAYDGPGGEQVGYLEPPADPRAAAHLQMMGGEFCGNAAMALGAYLAREQGLGDGDAAEYALEISGSDALAPCRIERHGTAYRGTVDMPLPEAVTEACLPLESGDLLRCPLVRLPGIAHAILPRSVAPEEARLRALLPAWHRIVGGDALGALVWDEAETAIDPLVYVPSAGTIVRERGCGSGSAAVGCWRAVTLGRACRLDISQPGGVITVEAGFEDGRVTALTITGSVRVTAEGVAFLEEQGELGIRSSEFGVLMFRG